jgi:hypothetical protein
VYITSKIIDFWQHRWNESSQFDTACLNRLTKIIVADSKFLEDVRQHLSFIIQGVITRIHSNSFRMKGWMETNISSLVALYASNTN